MMDEDAFLKAIRKNPDDDTPRLTFADWLEKQGDPWGEFIRIQCALARMSEDDDRRTEQQIRSGKLLAEHQAAWIGRNWWILEHKKKTFRRGFLEEICNLPGNHFHAIVAYTRCLAPRVHIEINGPLSWGFYFSELVTDPRFSRLTGLTVKNRKYPARAVFVGDHGVQALAESYWTSSPEKIEAPACGHYANPVRGSRDRATLRKVHNVAVDFDLEFLKQVFAILRAGNTTVDNGQNQRSDALREHLLCCLISSETSRGLSSDVTILNHKKHSI